MASPVEAEPSTESTSGKGTEDIDAEDAMEYISLNISGLLCSIGFSKKEVTVRQFKWHILERTDTLFRQYDNSVKGYVHSGSSSEGMTGGPYYSGEPSDFDTMKILANVKVVDNEQEIQTESDCRCTYVQEVPDPDFPGYVKLEVVKDRRNVSSILPKKDAKYYFPNSLATYDTAFQLKLEAVYKHPNPASRHHQLSDSELHGPAVSFKVSEPKDTVSILTKIFDESPDKNGMDRRPGLQCDIDMVACIESRKWPEIANNWISRYRPGNWPDKDLIGKLKATTVYLAPVGHKNSPDVYLQWRPSFNVAEKALIRDFNRTQINCYALLKIYLKDHLKRIVPDVLSSYCMKTTVFWMSEILGKENIVPEKLLAFFVECLKALKQWLHQGKVPHYFIESRNALGANIVEYEISRATQVLNAAIDDPVATLQGLQSFQRAIHASRGDPINFPALVSRSFMMAWLEMRCGMLERLHSCGTSYLFWMPFKDNDMNETIFRYRSIVSELQSLDFGQPFVELAQSTLGFLCYAKTQIEGTENKFCLMKEAEELVRLGVNGDSTLCPLKLATFYLGQNKPEEAYIIASKVMDNSDIARKRHMFIDTIFTVVHKQYETIAGIKDIETLESMYDLVEANARAKSYEELLYSRKGCDEAKELLNTPIKTMELLAFDVTFLLPEYSALPRVIQQELRFSRENEVQGHEQGVKLSPLMYAQYIRFLASKAMSDGHECRRVLSEFHDCIKEEHDFYKPRGYNILAACYDMLSMTHEAATCIVSSLKLDPTWHNVSFGYFLVIIDILLGLNQIHKANDLS